MSPALGVELLNRIMKIIKDYCGMLTEEAVRKNFALIYELLDEAIVVASDGLDSQDFGYPQDTTSEALANYVHNKPIVIVDPRVWMREGNEYVEECDWRCEQIGVGRS